MTEGTAARVADAVLGDLEGAERAEGERLVAELVDGWLTGSDGLDESDLVAVGTDELEDALGDTSGVVRLGRLREVVLERRVERLAGEAFRLARAVADEERFYADAAADAEAIRSQVDAALSEVDDVEDGERRQRLRARLADADLDARWIIAGREGATSHRLGHHLAD